MSITTVVLMNHEELNTFMKDFQLTNVSSVISFPSIIRYDNGDTYVGEICPTTNARHGRGTLTYAKGDSIKIVWIQNAPNGFGTYTYGNAKDSGSVIQGHWNYGQLVYGEVRCVNGDFYSGEMTTAGKHGRGTYISAETGEHYYGNFVNNKRFGYGESTWPNGSTYAGNWANDAMDGTGILTTATHIYSGPWRNNEQQPGSTIQEIN